MSGWFNVNTSCMLPQLHTHHPDEVPAAGTSPAPPGRGGQEGCMPVRAAPWGCQDRPCYHCPIRICISSVEGVHPPEAGRTPEMAGPRQQGGKKDKLNAPPLPIFPKLQCHSESVLKCQVAFLPSPTTKSIRWSPGWARQAFFEPHHTAVPLT